jgi:protein-tyrosine kinase
MHTILNFYVFLWKNKTVFFFFLIIIPLVSFFYLQNSSNKFSSVIEVKNYDMANFKNNYDMYNAKIKVTDNTITTSVKESNMQKAKAILQNLNKNIIADISYDNLTTLKQHLKQSSLNVASLLEKKKSFDKLIAEDSNNKKLYKDEITVIDNLYKEELNNYQKADLKFKNYALDKDIKVSYIQAKSDKMLFKFSLSVIFALFIAIIASFVRSFLNNSFSNKIEIKKATNIKTIDGLAKFKKLDMVNNKLMAGKLKVHTFTEISRIFKFISYKDRKTFAITSSIKNEGNSSLVIALAQHAAENGNKVLIVDMNLRNMELSIKLTKSLENWNITDKDFSNIYNKTINLSQNLDLLPALKDDASLQVLKISKNLKALINELKTKYDYVFIDTTSVFSVNVNNIDSIILGEAVDGVLINYLANRTKKRILLETIDKINMTESNILGIVTNNRYNPKLKDELLTFCAYLEKINKTMADNLRLKILKSYLLDEE